MKQHRRRFAPFIALFLALTLLVAAGLETAGATEYYYFKTPAADSSYKAGSKISVSFWAGVVIKETRCDQWGNPVETIYQDMPAIFKVYKGSTLLYSKNFTYQKGTTLKTTYTPKTTGTLKLQIYGQNMSLASTAPVLQKTIKIKVTKRKASSATSVKPVIKVQRTAKNAAKITCSNDYGYGMKVYRATKKDGKYKLVKTTSKSTYTDTGLSASKVYYYKVRLYAKGATKTYLSKWSGYKKAAKYVASSDTSTLSVTAVNTNSGVKISWKKVSKAGYYLVSRAATSTGDGEVITCNGEDDLDYVDEDAVSGKTYYYTVTAWHGNDEKPLVKSKAVKVTVK